MGEGAGGGGHGNPLTLALSRQGRGEYRNYFSCNSKSQFQTTKTKF